MPSGRSRRTSSVGSEFGLIRLLQAQAARPDRQVFKGIGDDTAILRETITSGRWACISGGTVVLRVEAGGSLLFDWSDPASGLKATAILAPPVS